MDNFFSFFLFFIYFFGLLVSIVAFFFPCYFRRLDVFFPTALLLFGPLIGSCPSMSMSLMITEFGHFCCACLLGFVHHLFFPLFVESRQREDIACIYYLFFGGRG